MDEIEETPALKEEVEKLNGFLTVVKREKNQALEEAKRAETALKKMKVKLERAKDKADGLAAENADLQSRLADKEKESADFQALAKAEQMKTAEQTKAIEDLTRQLEDLKAAQAPARAHPELNEESSRAVIESWKASAEYQAELKKAEEKSAQECLEEWSNAGFLDRVGLEEALCHTLTQK